MKKRGLAILLAIMMTMTMAAGCGKKSDTATESQQTAANENTGTDNGADTASGEEKLYS